MYTLGIDIGSASSKAVILKDGADVVASAVVQVGTGTSGPGRVLEEVFSNVDLTQEDMDYTVATGYGRFSVENADKQLSEITCHAKGIFRLVPSARTIIDIGGQDAKAIQLDNKGNILKFVMNDKCAAGTGRFLEMMARTLEMDISEMGPESLKWKEDIDISSMCSVFAESEVISLIALNKEKADIAHGLHKAIANKSYSLLKRVGLNETFMMTGGVAKNPGVVKAVEEKLGSKLFICKEPEIVGALGAALFGLDK